MKKKIISILSIILLIIAVLLGCIVSYAKIATTPLTLKLVKSVEDIGYGVGDPTNAGKYIYNIISGNKENQNLYCVKAEYGATWQTAGTLDKPVTYDLEYDLQTERDLLEKQLETDPNGVVAALIDVGGGQYEQLLWIFDNMYIAGKTDKDEYLAKAGITSGVLTEEDIIAVQKVAIWKFTNGGDYDLTSGETNWLNITIDGAANYKALSKSGVENATARSTQAETLYNYLVTSAASTTNVNKYASAPNYTIGQNKLTVNTEGLEKEGSETEGYDYILQTKIVNGRYITGPIKIAKTNNEPFKIDIAVTNNNGNVNYLYTNENGEEIKIENKSATIDDLVGGEAFYISTDIASIKGLNISIVTTEEKITKTLWLDKKDDVDTITLTGEQPIVEVKKVVNKETTNFIVKPFDLALRKYITAVNGVELKKQNGNYARGPVIEDEKLEDDTDTTATYKHRKDPVEVKDTDVVTYTLTIYNEGSQDGYATKIIDQLPEGLIWNNNSPNTVTSSKGNTYTIAWDQLTKLTPKNQITLTIKDKNEEIKAYTAGSNIDCETIKLECIVATTNLNSQREVVLTNVAWIAEACNSEGKQVIDRDSQPETIPSVDKNNISAYRGTTTEEELSNEDFFFKGQQDDDDFEKLIVKKNFDLALFKHIAAISKDQIIEAGEYITTNKNIDGTYLRAPKAVSINKDTGKITYEQNKQEPLTVEPGDYVLYTIRVYNEGEINGYASEIKDRLPDGLEFVSGNEEYNWIWTLNEELAKKGIQELTTNYLAKGKGKEELQPGANMLKALDKNILASDVEPKNPDYRDVQILCVVTEKAPTGEILINYAQISKDTDENGDDIVDKDSEPDNSTPEDWKGEDDEDTEKIILQCFDLSLRKFITSIGGNELKDNKGEYIRAPKVNTTPLKNGEDTAIYEHTKKPIAVQAGDKIIYTIRVYNEGKIDGYASEITDYLPKYLTYVKDSELNKKYNWQISEDGRIVKTTYLSSEEFKLSAFDAKADNAELDYADVQIECIVSENVPLKQNQTNIAEISEYTYNDKKVSIDRDSIANNMVNEKEPTKDYLPTDEELPSYKEKEINQSYVPGNEDDDDFEKIYVKEFDLALRKFISKVQETEVKTRVPQPKIDNGAISYEHTKEALIVHVGDVVIYTLRIYNEGEISGYASEITDDIPEYLEYLPQDSTNVQYMWKMYDENGNETEKVEEAVSLKTQYLSKSNGEDKLINAFDGTTLNYKDIQIAFKVKDPNSNTHIITNHAQISEDTDENENPINDNDSDTEAWNEGEDDQDIENIKVQYFDLSLLKFVSKVVVIENGKETITETGYNGHEDPEPVVKVELHKKKLEDVVVKFGYGITITNEGDIAGYATELTDYVPEGLKFDPSDNPEWTDEGNNIISTRQLEGVLLQPGQSTTVEVVFTWINDKNNMALKTNTAEISEDKNEYDVPDKDSTPDNKVEGEDDIDIAKVILNISTGSAKTYFTLTLGLLAVVLTGVVLIKKFVL